MKPLSLKSFAKVNLFLKVISKRPDGFHNLDTLFERINLFDTIRITRRQDQKIKIICSRPKVPLDESNLCFKAAAVLREITGNNQGINITITKRIPVGAGLGGGSSNAAAVLTGLNRLLGLKLSFKRLKTIADSIGSDVAFFLHNVRFARAKGKGDKITPLNELKRLKLWQVVVVPDFSVSTPRIYANLSRFSLLTRPKSNVKIKPLSLGKKQLNFLLFNTLEAVTLRLYPEVERIKKSLALLGLKLILMSGSGPAVVAIVSSRKEAISIAKQISERCKSWRTFAVSSA